VALRGTIYITVCNGTNWKEREKKTKKKRNPSKAALTSDTYGEGERPKAQS